MSHDKLLLGQTTKYPRHYTPDILFTIARAQGRAAIRLADDVTLPFYGEDVWTHYEISWLENSGRPCVAVGIIRVPADSPCLIESKSLKLYFNSLNFERFASPEAFVVRVEQDLSQVVQAPVTLTLVSPTAHTAVAITDFPGLCLDNLPLQCDDFTLSPDSLRTAQTTGEGEAEEILYSHLLRSLCPVTGQPDWGSVLVHYRGARIDHVGLLRYLVSYRQHADFHEQCVERIFLDIQRHCQPAALTVYARYTRRGGLDINPFRSTMEPVPEGLRLFRQ